MCLAIVVPAYKVDSGMAGIGVRAWELAQVAATRMPVRIIARDASDLSAPNVTIQTLADISLPELIESSLAFLFYDMADTSIMLAAHKAGKIIMSDCSVPIEDLEFDAIRTDSNRDRRYRDLVNRFRLQALLSDCFIVRSSVFRATLTATLSLIGRLNYVHYEESKTLDHLFVWIPIGFNRASALHARKASPSMPVVDFTWSGGIWDFYDPVALVRAVALLEEKRIPLSVRFMYPPPGNQVLREAGRLFSEVEERKLGHRIDILRRPPAHYGRDEIIKSSSALVCLARKGIENFMSVRLRLRDSLLYRMPLVVDKYGATGDFVRQEKIGLTVDSENPKEIADALLAIQSDTECTRELIRNIDAVRAGFEIDSPVLELVERIESRKHAPDFGSQCQSMLVAEVLARCPDLERPPEYPF